MGLQIIRSLPATVAKLDRLLLYHLPFFVNICPKISDNGRATVARIGTQQTECMAGKDLENGLETYEKRNVLENGDYVCCPMLRAAPPSASRDRFAVLRRAQLTLLGQQVRQTRWAPLPAR